MTAVPELIAILAWLVVCGLAPGAVAVCVLRVELGGRAERAMVVVAASVTLLGTAVFLLLLCGVYQRWIALALPAACCAYLARLAARRDERWLRLLARTPGERPSATPADRLALGVCWLLLALGFVNALTSPPTAWDATIHWDKWAADWGRRTHLHNYPYAYPQILPMFASLAYKAAGDGGEILPASAFAAHALHPLFGVVLLLALDRLAAAFRVPRWPVLLAVFGSQTVREQIGTGGVDLLLTAMTAAAAALALSAPSDDSSPPSRACGRLVALLLAGAIAVKPTGLLASAVVIATLGAWRFWPPEGVRAGRWKRASLLRLALVPALLSAPFYAWALYADLTYRLEKLDPRELHYVFVGMGSILATFTANARPRAGSAAHMLLEILCRPIASFGFPRALLLPLLAVLLLALVAAARDRRTRGLLAPLLVSSAVWAAIFSYDVRNFMPVLPFFGVALACGWQRLRAIARRQALRRAVGAAALVAAAFPVWGALSDARGIFAGLVSGPQSLSRRLLALESDVGTKVATYFPDQWHDYAFIKHAGLDRRARNVIAAGPLYRFFANGAYPVSVFWWGNLRPGDVYVSYLEVDDGPVEIDDWFLVRATPGRQTYVYGPQSERVALDELQRGGLLPPLTRAASATRLVVRYSGPQSLVASDVLARRAAPGSMVLWRLVAEGRRPVPHLRPVVVPSEPSLIDPERTSLAVGRHADGLLTYSGLVTLAPRPLTGASQASVLVGVASDQAGPRLRVREFRIWVRPPWRADELLAAPAPVAAARP